MSLLLQKLSKESAAVFVDLLRRAEPRITSQTTFDDAEAQCWEDPRWEALTQEQRGATCQRRCGPALQISCLLHLSAATTSCWTPDTKQPCLHLYCSQRPSLSAEHAVLCHQAHFHAHYRHPPSVTRRTDAKAGGRCQTVNCLAVHGVHICDCAVAMQAAGV